jgi:hypothetical protein
VTRRRVPLEPKKKWRINTLERVDGLKNEAIKIRNSGVKNLRPKGNTDPLKLEEYAEMEG